MNRQLCVAIALRIDVPYPSYQGVFAGVQIFARGHSHWKCVVDERPFDSIRDPSSLLGPYDGVIGRGNVKKAKQYAEFGLPFVNTMHDAIVSPEVTGAYIDTKLIGQMAAEHLMERGFQRLAFLSIGYIPQFVAIGEAFAREVKEWDRTCMLEDLDPKAALDADPDYWILARERLEPLLDRLTPPFAVVTVLPWTARLLITLCEARGWSVPMQVAVMCIGNMQTVLGMSPQITCIDSNYERVGYEAAKLLDQMMSGHPPEQNRVIVPPKGIITRESTDYFAVEDEVVVKALDFISGNLAENLSVGQVARKVAVTPKTLQRRFLKSLGRPVADELRRLRLELAKRMLGDDQFQIRRVAREAGFSSSANLARVFRRELGVTPSAYRRKLLGD